MGCYIHTTQPQLGKFQIKMVLYVFYKTRPLIKTEIKILETKFSQVFQEIKEDMQVVLCNWKAWKKRGKIAIISR